MILFSVKAISPKKKDVQLIDTFKYLLKLLGT